MRLKGKARKEAKAAAADHNPASKQPSAAQVEKHTLALKEYVPLAQAIASSTNMQSRVPPTILRIFQFATAARKRCCGWFRMQAPDEAVSEKSNKTHSYFISILEKVLRTLEPCCAWETGTRPANTAKASENISFKAERSHGEVALGNIFEYLEMEGYNINDPDQLDGEGVRFETTTTPASSAQSHVKVVYETEPSDADIHFAIFCLLEDLKGIRDFLRRIWSDYRLGNVDLTTASVTTDTAFELARRSEEDFLVAFPQFSDYEEVMRVLFPVVVKLHGLKEDRIDDVQFAAFDPIYWVPFRLLQDFLAGIYASPGHKSLPHPLRQGTYDPRTDRSKLLQMRNGGKT